MSTTIFSYASVHSLERAKERTGLSENAVERQISRALRKGKGADSFASWERKYLKNESYGDCNAIAYDGYCYIVSSTGFCITMYPLPNWFGKKKHFDGKEKIRNIKSYLRNYNKDDYRVAY